MLFNRAHNLFYILALSACFLPLLLMYGFFFISQYPLSDKVNWIRNWPKWALYEHYKLTSLQTESDGDQVGPKIQLKKDV